MSRGLSMLLRQCESLADELSIRFNVKKSYCMVFKPTRYKNLPSPCFRLNGSVIENTHEVKYLGHWITDDLKDDADILRRTGQIYGRGNQLIRKFASCSREVKLLLFKLHICPIYCLTIWREYKVETWDKLRVAYNDILRAMFRLPPRSSMTTFMVRNNIKSIPEMRRKLIAKFIDRLRACKNRFCNAATMRFFLLLTDYGCHWSEQLFRLPWG